MAKGQSPPGDNNSRSDDQVQGEYLKPPLHSSTQAGEVPWAMSTPLPAPAGSLGAAPFTPQPGCPGPEQGGCGLASSPPRWTGLLGCGSSLGLEGVGRCDGGVGCLTPPALPERGNIHLSI